LARKSGWTLAVVLVTVGLMLVQAEAQQRQARRPRPPGRDPGGGAAKKAPANAGDPLAKAGGAGGLAPGTFHYTFRLHSFDGAPLAASYYPSKLESAAPAVLLIHESGRSRKDFEDPVLELKGQGLAEHLQGLNYAALSLDLRGQGQNARRALSRDERSRVIEDVQAAYFFLVDRHNRGELNLAKLGVIALGDGSNLAAVWADQPGAASTTEARLSDLSAMVLVSPKPEGTGRVLKSVLASLAPRVSLLLLAGERDNPSKDALQTVRAVLERARLNKVELYPSNLHGYQLLRLEPKVTSTLDRFLETTLKGRAVDWEPEYNLTPVTFSDIQVVRNTKKGDTKGQAKPKDEAAQPKPKDKAEDAKALPEEKAKPKPAQPDANPPP
jgi:alpha-beta hydrolase superfamily lysophospholipase